MNDILTHIKDIVTKFGTILVDRRFVAAVASLAVLFFAVPESKSTAVLESVGVIVTTVLMLLGWSYRPPSGLQEWKADYVPPVLQVDVESAVMKVIEEKVGLKFPPS